jgi:hypothetical protein
MKNAPAQAKSIPPDLKTWLRDYWYPMAASTEVAADRPQTVIRLGEQLVVWRDGIAAGARVRRSLRIAPRRCRSAKSSMPELSAAAMGCSTAPRVSAD